MKKNICLSLFAVFFALTFSAHAGNPVLIYSKAATFNTNFINWNDVDVDVDLVVNKRPENSQELRVGLDITLWEEEHSDISPTQVYHERVSLDDFNVNSSNEIVFDNGQINKVCGKVQGKKNDKVKLDRKACELVIDFNAELTETIDTGFDFVEKPLINVYLEIKDNNS